MFEALRSMLTEATPADLAPTVDVNTPPADWLPPMGASRKTWGNVFKNKERMDFCSEQFHYLASR
jgi:hypothetical protein